MPPVAPEDAGYRVLLAVGADALVVVRMHRSSVLLLDMMMPGMRGVELDQHPRADSTTADIPTVAISDVRQLEDVAVVMAARSVPQAVPPPRTVCHYRALSTGITSSRRAAYAQPVR